MGGKKRLYSRFVWMPLRKDGHRQLPGGCSTICVNRSNGSDAFHLCLTELLYPPQPSP